MLTDNELQQINDEAEKAYPVLMKHYSNGEHKGMMAMCDSNYYEREAYIAGATKEREKAKELVRTLQGFVDGYDHDTDAHKYNNEPACIVCAAQKALTNYQNSTP